MATDEFGPIDMLYVAQTIESLDRDRAYWYRAYWRRQALREMWGNAAAGAVFGALLVTLVLCGAMR